MNTRLSGIVLATLTLSLASACAAGTITGKVDAKPPKFMENTVVYLDKVGEKAFAPPKDHAHMDQENLTFSPHVLAILAGTTVDFKNSDNVLHNVFSPDKCADQFNLGSWAKGEARSYTFKTAGCVSTVLCKVHPEMEAFVVVLQNPYFSVSKKDGSFSIADIPAGKYIVKAWNEKLKGDPQEVAVGDSDTTRVDIALKR